MKASYKQIIDIIFNSLPTDINPDVLKIEDVEIFFNRLNSNLYIDKNILEYRKNCIINLIKKYKSSISNEYTTPAKRYFCYELFTLEMNNVRISLFNDVREYNENSLNTNLNFMNESEILKYSYCDIDSFIKKCLFINYDKVPNIFYIQNELIKLIYTYYGLKNEIPDNLFINIKMNKDLFIDNQLYNPNYYAFNKKNYELFLKNIINDITKKFIIKQKEIIKTYNKTKKYVKK